MTPHVYGWWVHEFGDDIRTIRGRFAAFPSSGTIPLRTDSPDRDYFEVGAGLSANFGGNLTLWVRYETVLGLRDFDADHVTGGAVWEF